MLGRALSSKLRQRPLSQRDHEMKVYQDRVSNVVMALNVSLDTVHLGLSGTSRDLDLAGCYCHSR